MCSHIRLLTPWKSTCLFLAISACGYAPPSDPSLQAETRLFNGLDANNYQVKPVLVAWNKKDVAGAIHGLAAYFRSRNTIQWGKDSAPITRQKVGFIRNRAADNAALGKITGPGGIEYDFPNGKIDWHFDASTQGGKPWDDEWQWQMNRMGFWSEMANAYRSSGDEKYARAFASQFRSWILQCPPPEDMDNKVGSAWRTIDTGIRSDYSWPTAFFAFRQSSSLTDKDLVDLVAAFYEQGEYLRKFHTSFNWVTMEMGGLYAIGSLFPEFKESTEWRAYAIKTLADYAKTLFLPDGGEVELSTGYHNDVLTNLTHIQQIAGWNNRTADLTPEFLAPVESAFSWDVDLVTPDFSLPKLNDSWHIDLPGPLGEASTMYPTRRDFLWIASKGAKGTPPAKPSMFLDWSGLALMRDAYSSTTNYVLFRLGPMGAGHMHQDKLEVLLWAYGRELLFDSGGGPYEKSKWRTYGTSTFSHNCVIVDGLAQSEPPKGGDRSKDPALVSQAPIDGHWHSDSQFDFASGIYNGTYGPRNLKPAIQRRDVVFVKPDMYIVADRLSPSGSASHNYQARWNVLSTRSQIDRSTNAFVTLDAGQPNVAIIPLLSNGLDVNSASGQEYPEILGWQLNHDGNPQRTAATTLLHTRSGTGQQIFLTMILPLKPGMTNPVLTVKEDAIPDSATVTMKDGRRFVVSTKGSIGISVQEFLPGGGRGRWINAQL